MKNDIAKAICISSIWLSTSIVFAFGVFQFRWNGGVSVALMLVISLSILFAASYCTKAILKSDTRSSGND